MIFATRRIEDYEEIAEEARVSAAAKAEFEPRMALRLNALAQGIDELVASLRGVMERERILRSHNALWRATAYSYAGTVERIKGVLGNG